MTNKHQLPLQALVEDYQKGYSLSALAKKYGVSQQTIGRRFAEAGVILRPKEKELPTEQIVALYESGLSTSAIGERFSVSPQSIARHLKNAGKYRKRHPREWAKGVPPIPLDESRLRDLAYHGFSTREIGEEFGVSAECVRERMVKLDIPRLEAKARPEHNAFWKGGKPFQDEDGYILVRVPDHPYARKNGYVFEHRLVMEQKIGRYLLPEEVVHHRDDTHDNNHPDNLELYENNAAHLRETLEGKIPNWTPEGRERIRLGHPSLKKKASSIQKESENDEKAS